MVGEIRYQFCRGRPLSVFKVIMVDIHCHCAAICWLHVLVNVFTLLNIHELTIYEVQLVLCVLLYYTKIKTPK